MAKAKTQTSHWVVGVVLLVAGALIIATLVGTYSQGQLSNTGNLPANVNLTEDPPVIQISDALGWQTPEGGSIASFNPGDPLTGVVGGYTTVTVNVNVQDSNGYSVSNINTKARLGRTTSLAYPDFDAASSDETARLPLAGPVNCVDVHTTSDQDHTWSCSANIYFLSDSTTEEMSLSLNYIPENWAMMLRATDDTSNSATEYFTYEWPGIVGLSMDASVFLGEASTDGVATTATTHGVDNQGNMLIDLVTSTDKATDAAAWTCTGGNPLVSDIHHNIEGGSTDYAAMNALTLSDSNTTFTTFDLTRATLVATPSSKNMQFAFSTTEPVKPGLCTLSSIVFTSIKGF